MSIFLATFGLLWAGSVGFDFLKWKNEQVKNVSKPLYFSLSALTLVLYVSYAANIRIPMPTTFFIKCVAPWVKSYLRGSFHA